MEIKNTITGEVINTDKLNDLKAILCEKVKELSELCSNNNIAFSIIIDGTLSSFNGCYKKEEMINGQFYNNAPSYLKYLSLLNQGINIATSGRYGIYLNNIEGEEWKNQ